MRGLVIELLGTLYHTTFSSDCSWFKRVTEYASPSSELHKCLHKRRSLICCHKLSIMPINCTLQVVGLFVHFNELLINSRQVRFVLYLLNFSLMFVTFSIYTFVFKYKNKFKGPLWENSCS